MRFVYSNAHACLRHLVGNRMLTTTLLLAALTATVVDPPSGGEVAPALASSLPSALASSLASGATDSSGLLGEYADDDARQLLVKAQRASAKVGAEMRERATCAALRQLVSRALNPIDAHAKPISADERARAIATLACLSTPLEIQCALKVLDGEGSRPNFIACDPQVRRAIFAAMAKDPSVGQPKLVELAVVADDPVRQRALDSLPAELSPRALAEIARQLGSDREMYINRAASIAGSHPAASLIPSLVSAQYAAPKVKRGDEAWIAIGTARSYVQNQIPIVGDASTSFQPVIGTLFEGSLLRVMESMVEIFRTEVHMNLATVVEETTGQPAPPLGYDEARWMVWTRDELPRLTAAHQAERERDAETAKTVTRPAAHDG